MPSPTSARIACISPQFVEHAAPPALDDWLSYFDPEIALLTGDAPAPRARSTLRRHIASNMPLVHPAGNASVSGPHVVDGVQFVFAPSLSTIRKIDEFEEEPLDPTVPTFVVSGLLDLDVDTTSLTTSLLGRDEYSDALSPKLNGEYIHISTRLPADYRHQWDGLTVIGGGTESGRGDTPLIALDCRADGRLLTRSLTRSQLGLRALDQVGSKRAHRLREAGFTRRDQIADVDLSTLVDLPGIGRTTAKRIQQSATAIAHNQIVRESQEPLPDGDPVYIDIETDGLTPTITWLIGVLDGTADDGTYMSFLQTDPEDPGRALEDFMAWYTANASHRPLVAYRGWKFDFRVIHDHLVEYCPQYEDDWTSSYRFDPYRWAIENGNAILPGRTNTLEDVADALGYERDTTGLTGAAVARAYQQWMVDQSPSTELDWERYESYCEDDVRGLAAIYEALEESGRIVSTSTSNHQSTGDTTQQRLSEW